MSATMTKTELARIADEGYGPGAWHGNDLKAAVADVSPDVAFWRPAAGRHNIAEIALHHAWVTRRSRFAALRPPPVQLSSSTPARRTQASPERSVLREPR